MTTSITGQGITAYKVPDDALSNESKNAVQNKVVNEEVTDLQNAISQKQDAPATAGTAGQVLSLDSQLNPVWSTPSSGSGDVTDVQINGTSILRDGVANIPQATGSSSGVVWFGGNMGVGVQGGQVRLNPADSAQIKAGTNDLRTFTVNKQHEAAFYGLAKAAGDTTQSASSNPVGTYTDEAKTAIKSMLGVDNDYELIRFIELESDSREIYINTDDKNESFELGSFIIAIESVGASGSTREGYLKVSVNNTAHYPNRMADMGNSIRKAGSQCGVAIVSNYIKNIGRYNINMKSDNVSFVGSSGEIIATIFANQTAAFQFYFSEQQIVSSFWIGTDNLTDKLGAGSRIAIYGVRK